jgi:hypothetical protein
MAEKSLRDALEAAYDAEDTVAPDAPSTPEPEARGPTEDAPVEVRDSAPAEVAESPAVEPEPVKEPRFKQPESWKPAAREHWGKLPPEVQEDVHRRETEISQALQNTVGARRFTEAFSQMIRPYEQMLRVENTNPIQAADELFRTSAVLRMGTAEQKATLVANIVKRFGIDIEDLDRALVGETIPDQNGKLQQLIQQQLAPVNQFMSQIEQMRQQRAMNSTQEVDKEIAAFSSKEFYGDLRETMADLMDVAARQNKELTLQQAYDRALALNPEIQEIIAKRKQADMASKKRAASSLPSRSPTGGVSSDTTSIRSALEAAFDTVANR